MRDGEHQPWRREQQRLPEAGCFPLPCPLRRQKEAGLWGCRGGAGVQMLLVMPSGPCHSSAPSLQSLCVFSLANTEAGQAVINIMGIGVDTIDLVMASQPGR